MAVERAVVLVVGRGVEKKGVIDGGNCQIIRIEVYLNL